MKKLGQNKVFGIVALIFALVLAWVGTIIFETTGFLRIPLAGDVAIYWVSKALSTIILLVVAIWIIVGKGNLYFSIIALAVTAVLQIAPLVNRLVGQLGYLFDWSWAINLIITLVVYFAAIIFIFIFKINGDKYEKTLEFAKPKEIKVQDTDSFLDENGDLKGPGSY